MKKIILVFLSSLLILTLSCDNNQDSNSDVSAITVPLNKAETYEYRTGIGGDEEGASIILQAKHFEISDIIRNGDTQFEAVYRYRPEPSFSGTDYVEIQLSTGSDGASSPTNVKIVKIKFLIN